MKKLPEYTSDDNMFFYMNALVDLVNSQQEAIEKLESKVWTADFIEKYRPALENLADDTHRTVTLRIPKGMTFGWAMIMAYAKSYKHDDWVSFFEQSDTDLQKALDEVVE